MVCLSAEIILRLVMTVSAAAQDTVGTAGHDPVSCMLNQSFISAGHSQDQARLGTTTEKIE